MIADHSSEVLIVTGLLTMGAIAAFLAPANILKLVFGSVAPDAGSRFIVQHWGLLVFLVGALLVFAGRHSEVRVPVLVVAATEKLVGSGLMLTGSLRRRPVVLAIVAADSLMAVLYLRLPSPVNPGKGRAADTGSHGMVQCGALRQYAVYSYVRRLDQSH